MNFRFASIIFIDATILYSSNRSGIEVVSVTAKLHNVAQGHRNRKMHLDYFSPYRTQKFLNIIIQKYDVYTQSYWFEDESRKKTSQDSMIRKEKRRDLIY